MKINFQIDPGVLCVGVSCIKGICGGIQVASVLIWSVQSRVWGFVFFTIPLWVFGHDKLC